MSLASIAFSTDEILEYFISVRLGEFILVTKKNL